MTGLPYYRVRLEKRVVRCELEGLLVLAESGKIHESTLIIPPFSESWQAASGLIELSGRLSRDPWSAWSEMGESDGERIWAEFTAAEDGHAGSEDTDEGGRPHIAPLPAPPIEELPSLSESSMVPLEGPAAPGGPARAAAASGQAGAEGEPGWDAARGKVIAFPSVGAAGGGRARRPLTEGSHALAPTPFPVRHPPEFPVIPSPLPRRTSPRPPPPRSSASSIGLSWGRLTVMVGAGLAVLGLLRLYIVQTATADYPPIAAEVAPPPAAAQPAPTADPYAEMEAELRGQLRAKPSEVRTEGQLEDALQVELTQVRVAVNEVEAPVTRWSGPHLDQPREATVTLRLRSAPDRLDRDLGAAALVVGKYKQSYSLDLASFEVIFEDAGGGSARKFTINPNDAQDLYIKRVSLLQFIERLGSQ